MTESAAKDRNCQLTLSMSELKGTVCAAHGEEIRKQNWKVAIKLLLPVYYINNIPTEVLCSLYISVKD